MTLDLFLIAVQQAPALVVLAVVVLVFVREIKARDKAFMEFLIARDKSLETIGKGCHEVQREAIGVIKECTVVLGRVIGALDRLESRRK